MILVESKADSAIVHHFFATAAKPYSAGPELDDQWQRQTRTFIVCLRRSCQMSVFSVVSAEAIAVLTINQPGSAVDVFGRPTLSVTY
jgi:hypothetical protein